MRVHRRVVHPAIPRGRAPRRRRPRPDAARTHSARAGGQPPRGHSSRILARADGSSGLLGVGTPHPDSSRTGPRDAEDPTRAYHADVAPARRSTMRLIVFDIDGTILLNGPITRRLFGESFAEVVGREPESDTVRFHGNTDRGI